MHEHHTLFPKYPWLCCCTTTTWNVLVARFMEETSYVLGGSLAVHVHVALQFIFTLLAASIFHFLNTAIIFSWCFLPTKFVSSGFYLPLFGLSLLSTSVKTLKFSRKKNSALLLLFFCFLLFFFALFKSRRQSIGYQLFLASIGFHVSIFYGNGGLEALCEFKPRI